MTSDVNNDEQNNPSGNSTRTDTSDQMPNKKLRVIPVVASSTPSQTPTFFRVPSQEHDAQGRCHYFLARKHRFCKQVVAPANVYPPIPLDIFEGWRKDAAEFDEEKYDERHKSFEPRFCVNHHHQILDAFVPKEKSENLCVGATSCTATESAESTPVRPRIACPVDPSHTIYQDQLGKHIAICPKAKQRKREQAQVYYQHNINCGGCGNVQQDLDDTKQHLADQEKPLTEDETKHLALLVLHVYRQIFLAADNKHALDKDKEEMRIEESVKNLTYSQIYNSVKPNIYYNEKNVQDLLNSLSQHRVRSGGWKHVAQQASVASILRRLDLLTPPSLPTLNNHSSEIQRPRQHVVIDMGAGRGMLGLVIAGIMNQEFDGLRNHEQHQVHLVLVERGSSKAKADGKIRQAILEAAEVYKEGGKLSDENDGEAQVDYPLCPSENSDDVSKPRSLMDLKIDSINLNRIRCDLAHVHLKSALDQILGDSPSDASKSKCEQHVQPSPLPARHVVVAKHLCGCGTDFALKSMTSILNQTDGCVFATCCHGACNWNDYVGRDTLATYFNQAANGLSGNGSSFGKREFDVIRKWTTGTVCCGRSTSTAHGSNETAFSTVKAAADDIDDEHDNFQLNERFGKGMKRLVEELNLSCGVSGFGRCCQRIIDYGRVVYMRDVLGFCNVDMVHFVDEGVSPQNAVLIGTKK